MGWISIEVDNKMTLRSYPEKTCRDKEKEGNGYCFCRMDFINACILELPDMATTRQALDCKTTIKTKTSSQIMMAGGDIFAATTFKTKAWSHRAISVATEKFFEYYL